MASSSSSSALPIVSRDQGAALAAAMRDEDFARAEALFASLAARHRIPPKMAAAFGDFAAYWGRVEAAERAYTVSLAEDPSPGGVLNRGLSRLRLGDWRRGWIDMEQRIEARRLVPFEAIRGKTSGREVLRWRVGEAVPDDLVVFTEQGLGDTLQFARFLPDLVERGVAVTVVGPTAVAAAIRGLPNAPRFQALGTPLRTRADRWCCLMSLPALLGFAEEQDLVRPPYLFQDLVQAPVSGGRRSPGQLRIGLCWQGNPDHPNDARRSAPLSSFTALMTDPRFAPVSLQIGPGADQIAEVPSASRLETPLSSDASLSQTAAVIVGLDLVVSVDTAVAHLAGGMGRPTALLLSAVGVDWRWSRGRRETPWYGSMTIHQQATTDDWRAPLEAVLDMARGQAASD